MIFDPARTKFIIIWRTTTGVYAARRDVSWWPHGRISVRPLGASWFPSPRPKPTLYQVIEDQVLSSAKPEIVGTGSNWATESKQPPTAVATPSGQTDCRGEVPGGPVPCSTGD